MANEKVQVRERAGLEESRLNEELVDFLRSKTFTWLCVLLAVGALGYSGYRKYREIEKQKIAAAFADYEQATATEDPSPDALERIAEAYTNVRGVGTMARLAAADAHLRVVRAGLKPGVVTDQQGTVAKEDLLTEEDRKLHLDRADALYKQVAGETQGVQGKMIQTVEAVYGQAAVAESRRDFEGAKKFYQQVVTMTEGGSYAAQAEVAKSRIAALANLGDPKLVSRADMPWLYPPTPTVVSPNATPEQTAPTPVGPAPVAGPSPTEKAPEANPAEQKPAEAKPAEVKPAEAKPAEAKPADPPANPK